MKNTTLHITLIALFLVLFNCRGQEYQSNPLGNQILGTWQSNEDELLKIQFNSSGQRKDYYENQIIETSSYSIVATCNGYTRSNNEFFLRSTYSNSIVTCELLNNIHTDENGVKTLSITTDRGQLCLYTKQ